VDVLIKYGLGAKAVEQLEGIVRKFPASPAVRSRLLNLYRDQKKTDKAVLQALMLAELYETRGQEEESRGVLRSALELAPGNAQIMAKLGIEEPATEEPETVETIEEPEEIETLAEVEELPELALPELEIAEPAALEEEEPSPPPARRRPAPAPEPEPEEPEEVSFEPEVMEEAPGGEPLAAGGDIAETWAEAEFYYQQGLFDEARRSYEKVLELKPGDRKAMERIVELTREKEDIQELSRLAEAVEGLEAIVEGGPAGPVEETVTRSDVDSVRSLMDQITDMRRAGKPAAPSPPPPPPGRDETEESFAGIMEEEPPAPLRPAARPAPDEDEETSFADLGGEETSFAGLAAEPADRPAAPAAGKTGAGEETDESGDFFDLAAELRDELSATAEAKPASAHEQSLDEIFEEFKAGVEAHEKKEDEDTHYNLGIAYREMGLLDDAISEFNMTNEGEPKFILGRYMLGLCYLEKGDYETAIAEIQNALGYSYSFGEASEERIGMHYDLGLAYQGVGNNSSALEEFQKVYNLDPSYREVAAKMKDLQDGEFISLDAIKEDIEKEISFKFLEEGARIEREEKTKKAKK
jgi:tetratricopeptide (TPR) repeat protein